MEIKTLDDIDVKGKKVLIRVGLDVPIDPKKDLLDPERVTDDTRINDIMPTLKCLIENDAKVIMLAGWCGRPKGVDPDLSMAPVAKKIEQILERKGLLKHPVLIAPDCFIDKIPKSTNKNKEDVKKIVESLEPGQVVVLENVRYDPEANANDPQLGKFFASLGEVYVNDNETQNHRPETSIVTTPVEVAKNNGKVVFGFKYAEVLDKIGNLKDKLTDPSRDSFVFGLCGKKIESDPGITSKISVAIELLDQMKKGDTIITGGAVIYTFLLAEHYSENIEKNIDKVNDIVNNYNNNIIEQTKNIKDKKESARITEELQKKKSDELKSIIGIKDEEIKELIGNSYIRWGQEGEQIVFAYNMMKKASQKDVEMISALDHCITDKFPDKFGNLPKDAEVKLFNSALRLPKGFLGVGEGEKTLKKISSIIEKAGIYLQSGPYSIEDDKVENISHTDKITFDAVKACKNNKGITIAAGGDTVARVNKRKSNDTFSVITSAGGATLELIQTGTSRGKEAVEKAWEIKP